MTKSFKSIAICSLSLALAGTLAAGQVVSVSGGIAETVAQTKNFGTIADVTGRVSVDTESMFDPDVVKKLPATLSADREVSVIVETSDETVLSAYLDEKSVSRYREASEFADSAQGRIISERIGQRNSAALAKLRSAGVRFEQGASYDTILGGFEVVVKAGEYEKIVSALEGSGARAYISEEFAVCDAQLVTNDVNVYDTGIFDSSASDYDGRGTVVAVLDTGLDYTHSVFDNEVFKQGLTESDYGLTRAELEEKMSLLKANEERGGTLTVANVYRNEKVPFGFDYADHDEDVFPLDEAHGTHVAGVILGDNRGSALKRAEDPEIVGVAPKAQIAVMKVFSDNNSGARWSWIVSALEDCVTLGVDVINMSLGATAGFSVETEEEQAAAYDLVDRAGISLVCAAGNEYSSVYGSEKNGNLGLTTNPDTGTPGSPSTYQAALSVASISGVKSSYFLYEGQIMYFTESSNAAAKSKNFVTELFDSVAPNAQEMEFDYVTIPGIGRDSDYIGIDVRGKIALVRRGDTTFEDKTRLAMRKGAAGVIIYNNVSGTIAMTVGNLTTAGGLPFPACSISQDNGKVLAAHSEGKLKISRTQMAGPFMSEFSSWGPTPDLRIKPEITAHGGDILSAVPGERYEKMSGTSMACPNQAGVTALVRQYVKENAETFGIDRGAADFAKQVNAIVCDLMMSTADIARNMNGLPYAVRKQGAGLANLTKSTSTKAYVSTFERDDADLYNGSRYTDKVMDRAKIEVGDDPQRTGRYELKFNINNIAQSSPLTYEVNAITMTEGISPTLTYKGDTTVSQEGYLLGGAHIEVTSVTGGSKTGNTVTVPAGSSATVTAYITLGESDIAYLEQESQKTRTNADGEEEFIPVFDNGMYIEGYVTLSAQDSGSVSLNVPYLAFYGDWTEAPMFDLDYFATDRDAQDDSFVEPLDRTLPDAVATIPIGGLSGDYISYLGSYYFQQTSSSNKISASREHVSISSDSTAVDQIYAISAGLLRGAKKVVMTITDAVTGEKVWERIEYNQRKASNPGSGEPSASSIEVEYTASQFHLQDNTKYNFRAEAFLDYGDGGVGTNKNRVFEFPFVMDSTAPILQNVEYYTEYDRQTKKSKLYARMYIYDNHYAMALLPGVTHINENASEDPTEYGLTLDNFTTLPTPINSSFNSTSIVTYELTNYLDDIRGSSQKNTYYVGLYDYALNFSIFEVTMPDDVQLVHFNEDSKITYAEHGEDGEGIGEPSITLQTYETYVLQPEVFPASEWRETLQFLTAEGLAAVKAGRDPSAAETVVRIVNGTLVGLPPAQGEETHSTTLYVFAADDDTYDEDNALATLHVTVGGVGYYTQQWGEAGSLRLKELIVNKAFHFISSIDRDIGETGDILRFAPSSSGFYGVSMYPSESVTAVPAYNAYFPADTTVVFESSDDSIVSVSNTDAGAVIEARAFGSASVTASVYLGGKATLASFTIMIEVKDPIERNGPYLTSWRGLPDEDGTFALDEELGFTEISQYAFSHYVYIPKDPWDEIYEEDPSTYKLWYAGENDNVKKIILPEGVETIGSYAFAGMEGLEEVVLPSTVKKIATGAFMGCTSLRKINLENVQFIGIDAFAPGLLRDNDDAFIGYTAGVPLEAIELDNVVGIGDNAFMGVNGVQELYLPATAQSIGTNAFANSSLVTVSASGVGGNIKFGTGVFAGCTSLYSASFNTTVIPDSLFEGDSNLATFKLGENVESIGNNAFSGTRISDLGVSLQNLNFFSERGVLFSGTRSDAELVLVVPGATFTGNTFNETTVGGGITITRIGSSAFSGNAQFRTINLPHVTEIGDYAFWDCAATSYTFGTLTRIGAHAFENTNLGMGPFGTNNEALSADGLEIGDYAFHNAFTQATRGAALTFGDHVRIGAYAFLDSQIGTVTFGGDAVIGTGAFMTSLEAYYDRFAELSPDAARYVAQSIVPSRNSVLRTATFGANAAIGDYAFAGNYQLQTVSFTNADGEGSGTTVGDYAFYLDSGLASLGNSQAVVWVGDNAFSGSIPYIIIDNTTVVMPYYVPYDDLDLLVSTQLTEVDLSGAEHIGAGAFAYNINLKRVTLHPGTGDTHEPVTFIGDRAFFGSTLETVENLEKAKSIGASAFAALQTTPFWIGEHAFTYENTISVADLSGADSIGAYVFENSSSLNQVVLKAGAHIGASAFSGATSLSVAENLDKAVSIGSSAFFNTALAGELDFTAAEEIGDFAFGYLYTEVDEAGNTTYFRDRLSESITSVKFGDRLMQVGDNPFSGRALPRFVRTETGSFHGKPVGETETDTFAISENVKVIGGVLYAKVPNGYELISYPAAAEETSFAVADGVYDFGSGAEEVKVIRVAARAFQGARALKQVTLPFTLLSIGDKAFYGTDLSAVVFQSIAAPVLEEDYNEDYFELAADLYMPSRDPDEAGFEGYRGSGAIGFVSYTAIVLRTANFGNYIGKEGIGSITMIRPKNGTGYDNYLYDAFFGDVFDGASAMEDATYQVYLAIEQLPDLQSLTIGDADLVMSVKAMYDAILSTEQIALITNSDKLERAVSYIENLQKQPGPDEPGTDDPTPADPTEPTAPAEDGAVSPAVIGLSVAVAVLGALLIAGGVVFYIKTVRKKGE